MRGRTPPQDVARTPLRAPFHAFAAGYQPNSARGSRTRRKRAWLRPMLVRREPPPRSRQGGTDHEAQGRSSAGQAAEESEEVRAQREEDEPARQAPVAR